MTNKPRKEPKLVYSMFTSTFYIVTSYDIRADGSIEPHTKHDCTEQVLFLADDIARVARLKKKASKP